MKKPLLQVASTLLTPQFIFLKRCMILSTLLTGSLNSVFGQDNVTYPAAASSRVLDVTKSPYNADKTGVNDATAAIQEALNDADGGPNIIYLPNGTYKVSNRLNWAGDQKRDIMIGQSRAGTIIKLADGAPGYGSTTSPKAVIWTGTAPAQRFSNGIRNLTVNTGSGNPGAIGIQFIANNQGGIENVLIKNNDNQGIYGLDLGYTDEQGPCLIKKVEVVGFNIGIRTIHAVDGVVLSNIKLTNQKQYAIYNDGQCLSIENMTTSGSVPAIHNIGAGVVAVINSTFTGTGAASGIAAINNYNGLFARNISTTGFSKAINNQKGGSTSSGANVTEFVSHPVLSLFASPKQSLNLTVKAAPELAWDTLTDWVNVGDYAAQTITLPNGHVVQDYTNALQQAIDAGKSTVYFGNNSGAFWGTVRVRGNVKRIIGLEAWMGNESGSNGTLIIENGTSPTVIIEKFSNIYNQFNIIHNASRTAVVKNMMLKTVDVNGTGDLFLEDVVADGLIDVAAGCKVYGRQLNVESLDEPKVKNNGSLWILGIKTERDATAIRSYNGSQTEVIGGFIYANKDTNPDKVMFINENGSKFSATVGEWVIRNQPFNPVKETRGTETRLLAYGDAYGRGTGSMMPLYTGYAGTTSQSYTVDNTDPGFSTTGTWTASTSSSQRYGINYLHDGDTGANTTDVAKWMSPITTTGMYDVYMIWAAQSDRPDAAPVEVNYDGGVYNTTVNQKLNGGTWVKITTRQFTGGSGDYVSIKASDDGNTIADAVRWVPAGGAVGGLSVDQTTEALSLANLKEESATSNGLLVYPNPTSGSVNLSFTAEQNGQASIEFYNAMGQKALSVSRSVSAGANNLKVDLSAIPNSGVYYIKVTSGSKNMTQTVLINK